MFLIPPPLPLLLSNLHFTSAHLPFRTRQPLTQSSIPLANSPSHPVMQPATPAAPSPALDPERPAPERDAAAHPAPLNRRRRRRRRGRGRRGNAQPNHCVVSPTSSAPSTSSISPSSSTSPISPSSSTSPSSTASPSVVCSIPKSEQCPQDKPSFPSAQMVTATPCPNSQPWTDISDHLHTESSVAQFSYCALDNPLYEGSFKWVTRGSYISGPYAGTECVAKWNKKHSFQNDILPFKLDMLIVKVANPCIMAFNAIVRPPIDILLISPVVYRIDKSERQDLRNVSLLVEPFVNNFTKFNCNDGWADVHDVTARIMQALSHFSYHLTAGNLAIVDIQGCVNGNLVSLSDLAVLSKDGNFGDTDLGDAGLEQFFFAHVCTEFCDRRWLMPQGIKRQWLQDGDVEVETDEPAWGAVDDWLSGGGAARETRSSEER